MTWESFLTGDIWPMSCVFNQLLRIGPVEIHESRITFDPIRLIVQTALKKGVSDSFRFTRTVLWHTESFPAVSHIVITGYLIKQKTKWSPDEVISTYDPSEETKLENVSDEASCACTACERAFCRWMWSVSHTLSGEVSSWVFPKAPVIWKRGKHLTPAQHHNKATPWPASWVACNRMELKCSLIVCLSNFQTFQVALTPLSLKHHRETSLFFPLRSAFTFAFFVCLSCIQVESERSVLGEVSQTFFSV